MTHLRTHLNVGQTLIIGPCSVVSRSQMKTFIDHAAQFKQTVTNIWHIALRINIWKPRSDFGPNGTHYNGEYRTQGATDDNFIQVPNPEGIALNKKIFQYAQEKEFIVFSEMEDEYMYQYYKEFENLIPRIGARNTTADSTKKVGARALIQNKPCLIKNVAGSTDLYNSIRARKGVAGRAQQDMLDDNDNTKVIPLLRGFEDNKQKYPNSFPHIIEIMQREMNQQIFGENIGKYQDFPIALDLNHKNNSFGGGNKQDQVIKQLIVQGVHPVINTIMAEINNVAGNYKLPSKNFTDAIHILHSDPQIAQSIKEGSVSWTDDCGDMSTVSSLFTHIETLDQNRQVYQREDRLGKLRIRILLLDVFLLKVLEKKVIVPYNIINMDKEKILSHDFKKSVLQVLGDEVPTGIRDILLARMYIVKQIGGIKKDLQKDIVDTNRKQQVLHIRRQKSDLDSSIIEKLYNIIHDYAVQIQ